MKYFTLSVLLVFLAEITLAQSSYPFKVATNRMLWHDKVDALQQKIDEAGTYNNINDELVKLYINGALAGQIDQLQESIELDTIMTNQEKVKYLVGVESMLKGFLQTRGNKDYPSSMAPQMVRAFEESMQLDKNGESIEPVILKNKYGVGKIIVDCFLSPSPNKGVAVSRQHLLKKFCEMHPDQILPTLASNPDVPFANEFIVKAAHHDIRKLYNYAAANNALGYKIRRHPDSLVRMVGAMSVSRYGQHYFPFLTLLLEKKITLEEIDKIKDNDFEMYRLMVKTRIDYSGRQLPPFKDTVMEMNALTERMTAKAKQHFIREINGLHHVANENIRYKRLEGLNARELYYLIVLGEDELYTSSYLHVYKRIFREMKSPRGDSLLMNVNGDYFRKFIKMAAGYNTLNNFLATMDKENATTTMKAFVIKLEETRGLEEAVDVADSYSSIMDKNPELARYILEEVKWNKNRNIEQSNERGTVIYKLLQVLFESADTNNKSDQIHQLGIPSIYNQDYKALTDSAGRVIQQVFFYGDEDQDGQISFENFMGMFRGNPAWKISSNEYFVTITSTRGKPVMIFANKPLLGADDPDAKAQAKLAEYLSNQNLQPTIMIHRGHSYHLPYTLNQLQPSAKIIVLGSCGGYNNLNEVLNICKDAHIISSKQIGTKAVNEPILNAINNHMVAGKDIDWISLWGDLSKQFTNAAAKEKFEDYIPPYKNLGAIFIKAYKRAMNEEG